MDIKAEIEKIVAKVSKDEKIQEKFQKDPMGTAKELLGDLSTKIDPETMKKIVEAAKTMLASGQLGDLGDKLTGMLGGAGGLGALSGLLGGKKDKQ